MNVLEIEEQAPLRTAGVRNNSFVRYVLPILATIYLALSLYFIFDSRSRLASLARNGECGNNRAATTGGGDGTGRERVQPSLVTRVGND